MSDRQRDLHDLLDTARLPGEPFSAVIVRLLCDRMGGSSGVIRRSIGDPAARCH